MQSLILMLILIIVSTISCTASTSSAVNPDIKQIIKADLIFKIDGVTQYGSSVLMERKTNYKIEVPFSLISPDKPLKLFFQTCHRSPDPFFGFKQTDIWMMQYYPVANLEDTGSCLAFITVLTEAGIRHIGIIDFKDGTQTLPMRVWGNGNFYNQDGAVFIQALEKNIQSVSFNEPVRIVEGNNCNAMIQAIDSKTGVVIPNSYEFQAPLGVCVYVAKGRESGKLGKLTVRGFYLNKDQ